MIHPNLFTYCYKVLKLLVSPFLFSILIISSFACEARKGESHGEEKIKVACIGNSITHGMGMVNRKKNAYPAQLSYLLGDDSYEVRNFGVSGTTLLRKGGQPYWDTEAYENALAYAPDVAIILLGTNDSKKENRPYYPSFEADYKELIASFKKVNSEVRVVLLLPIPSHENDSTLIQDPVIREQIIPMTRNVAYETGAEIVDLYRPFVDRKELIPDQIHPSSLGGTLIARKVYEQLSYDNDPAFDLMTQLELPDTKKSSFHGFDQFEFDYLGVSGIIVRPRRSNAQKDWIWRARFWGHEPQTDLALLERGFHLVYYDVSNLYGNQVAVERWNKFYALLTEGGLNKKAVLEGMSRGGLIIYNWAAQNTEKVACIYADAPVLDIKSWPGGQGSGKGSLSDWKQAIDAYNLTYSEAIDDFKGSPLDKVALFAASGIPIYHVCGDDDQVVPVSENTRLFEKKLLENGGSMKTIYKEGIGHHPHSLQNPTSIVDFILRATGNKPNFAAIPSPGSEYRSAAGWKKGKDWWSQKEDIENSCSKHPKLDLLLLGNSITQGWGGHREYVSYAPGKKAADTYFQNINWVNGGISGDRAEHIGYRVLHGNYHKANPRYVALTIGVNNFPMNTANEIAEGIINTVSIIQERFPESTILLFGPLPTGIEKNSIRRKKYHEIHRLIQPLSTMKNLSYHPVEHLFVDEKGNLDLKLYGGDGIHLHPEGYEVWANYISKIIE